MGKEIIEIIKYTCDVCNKPTKNPFEIESDINVLHRKTGAGIYIVLDGIYCSRRCIEIKIKNEMDESIWSIDGDNQSPSESVSRSKIGWE